MNSYLHRASDHSLRHLVSRIAPALPMIALLVGLVSVGVWTARWSGSALLGVVAANLAFVFVAAFFPVNRPDRR